MIYYMTPETARVFVTGLFADHKELVQVTNQYVTDEFFDSYVVFNVDRSRSNKDSLSFKVKQNNNGDVMKRDVVEALRNQLHSKEN